MPGLPDTPLATELHKIARDALRVVGIDVPDDITPEQILILTDDLLEGA